MAEEEKQWHIKREVSVGDVVAIATALVAVIVSYMNLDSRVKIVEVLTQQNSTQLQTTVTDIKSDMRRLADRVERIVETHNRDLNGTLKGK